MVEEWKEVVGFEGFYEVSNMGNVRSVPHMKSSYGGRRWLQKGKLLRPTRVKDKGYRVVSLCVGGVATRRYVHDLVLCAFVGPRPEPTSHCCHGAAGSEDNSLGNLRWDTPVSNAQDRNRDGTMQIGERHWKNVYSEDQIRSAKRMLKDGIHVRTVALATLIKENTVWAIKSGRQWAHLSA